MLWVVDRALQPRTTSRVVGACGLVDNPTNQHGQDSLVFNRLGLVSSNQASPPPCGLDNNQTLPNPHGRGNNMEVEYSPASQPGPDNQGEDRPASQHGQGSLANLLLLNINHWFTLNLTKGNDIAMHINPRFDDQGKKTIVRNSLIGSKWGKEEREHNHFPFTQGQPFEMKIMCTNNEFRVAVNNSHLLEYKHRIRDLDSIKHLGIYNDVTLTSVEIDNFNI
ncbi:galectin-3b isoform X4 [Salmo salar]|nr:galectin-3b isoform X4 [Salmo salar]|eukprot:XP_014050247.1 PREDICTED: uncharacterized protein LOC106602243 isoform X4 [Salmo salar]